MIKSKNTDVHFGFFFGMLTLPFFWSLVSLRLSSYWKRILWGRYCVSDLETITSITETTPNSTQNPRMTTNLNPMCVFFCIENIIPMHMSNSTTNVQNCPRKVIAFLRCLFLIASFSNNFFSIITWSWLNMYPKKTM